MKLTLVVGRVTGVGTPRYVFATHLPLTGTDIRTVQELLSHSDMSTTMIYTPVLKSSCGAVRSPLDALVLTYRVPFELSVVGGC